MEKSGTSLPLEAQATIIGPLWMIEWLKFRDLEFLDQSSKALHMW